MKRLLLIGGGHSHVEVLRQFAIASEPAAGITLVSDSRYLLYSGMLPGLVAGHYREEECRVDLQRLAQHAGAAFFARPVTALAHDRAELADGTLLEFDIASIDIGSTPPLDGIEGARFALPVKPIEHFLQVMHGLVMQVRSGEIERIAVVGGGAAGVEVLLALRYRLEREAPHARPQYQLVTDAPTILPSHNARARAKLERILRERDVQLRTGSKVTALGEGVIHTDDGRRIEADAIVWATGASAAAWPAAAGLAADERGFVRVDRHLRSLSHANLFAAGDIASIEGAPVPKSGVYAVRQGPILAANLRAAFSNGSMRTFRARPHTLALISTGDKHAVAARGRWAIEGDWVWRWKDWVDRRWVRKYAMS